LGIIFKEEGSTPTKHSSAETEENKESPQSRDSVSGHKFELGTFHYTAKFGQ